MLGRPGVVRSVGVRAARPASASASRWNRAVLGCRPVWSAMSLPPTGEPAARSRSSTWARLWPSGAPASGAGSACTSIPKVYINQLVETNKLCRNAA